QRQLQSVSTEQDPFPVDNIKIHSHRWGDMNAKLRVDNTGRELTMGQEALGEVINENEELFAEFCTFNDLVIGVRQCVQTQAYLSTKRYGFDFTRHQDTLH
ncbi:unnamed protein product, partial [Heterobilharzia americana]